MIQLNDVYSGTFMNDIFNIIHYAMPMNLINVHHVNRIKQRFEVYLRVPESCPAPANALSTYRVRLILGRLAVESCGFSV
jgi:hypothetical protein